MSETEHHTGKLIPVKIEKSLEETCKQICEDAGFLLDEFYTTWKENLRDNLYEEYFIYKDVLYRIESKEHPDDDYMVEASEYGDGTINFQIRFYNGSCGFDEALEDAMDKLDG